MLKLIERVETAVQPRDSLTLAFEYRQKSRQRVELDSGVEAGLFLPRGTVLRGGDVLRSEDDQFIRVIAALEPVSIVTALKRLLLMRACYHLGNRHVNLQITDDSIRYQQDYVLDELVTEMGLVVRHKQISFEPEPGAYGSKGHSHTH